MSARTYRICASAIALLVATGTALVHPASAAADDTVLVTKANGFGPKSNATSESPSISADGRYVAFHSIATNLDPDDNDATQDVFVRDVASGATTLVSRATGATGVKGDGASSFPSISADGRYVAFASSASNLHGDDTDSTTDIFVRDLVTYSTTLASRAHGASGAKGNGTSAEAFISADGSSVAFRSVANNLHPDDGDPTDDIYVRNVITHSTTLVSRANGAGGAKGNGQSADPRISAGGQFVAFSSFATNLHADDGDATQDVFVRDLTADTTRLASRANGAAGAKGDANSSTPSISADGRVVAFRSIATNLHADDGDATQDVFVRDLTADTTRLASRAHGAAGAKGDDNSFQPSVSADGSYVAFTSFATNLHPEDVDGLLDIAVRDLISDATTLVSRASGSDGDKGDGGSFQPSISSDGRFVAFRSGATNLHADDTDSTADIFVRDVLGPQPPPALSIADVRAKEGKTGTTPFTFAVTLDGVPGRTVTVDFATKNGTATVGDNDYRFTNGTLTFLPGETSQQVVVDVVGDKKKEKTETFKVKLFNATGAEIDDLTGIGTIVNDDKKRR